MLRILLMEALRRTWKRSSLPSMILIYTREARLEDAGMSICTLVTAQRLGLIFLLVFFFFHPSFHYREFGCPCYIRDCGHIQPGELGYVNPAEKQQISQAEKEKRMQLRKEKKDRKELRRRLRDERRKESQREYLAGEHGGKLTDADALNPNNVPQYDGQRIKKSREHTSDSRTADKNKIDNHRRPKLSKKEKKKLLVMEEERSERRIQQESSQRLIEIELEINEERVQRSKIDLEIEDDRLYSQNMSQDLDQNLDQDLELDLTATVEVGNDSADKGSSLSYAAREERNKLTRPTAAREHDRGTDTDGAGARAGTADGNSKNDTDDEINDNNDNNNDDNAVNGDQNNNDSVGHVHDNRDSTSSDRKHKNISATPNILYPSDFSSSSMPSLTDFSLAATATAAAVAGSVAVTHTGKEKEHSASTNTTTAGLLQINPEIPDIDPRSREECNALRNGIITGEVNFDENGELIFEDVLRLLRKYDWTWRYGPQYVIFYHKISTRLKSFKDFKAEDENKKYFSSKIALLEYFKSQFVARGIVLADLMKRKEGEYVT